MENHSTNALEDWEKTYNYMQLLLDDWEKYDKPPDDSEWELLKSELYRLKKLVLNKQE